MKYLVFACTLWGLGTVQASPLSGVWQYDGFIYEQHRYPNPNPDLFLTFTFTDGISRLFWRRNQESGFCERIADFSIDQNILHQKVTWTNPKNRSECAGDPDMRVGSDTQVRFRVTDQYLELYFEIRGKEFVYLLKRTGCVFE